MSRAPRFLTDKNGKRIAVVLDIKDYERIIEELEDVDDLRAYDAAKAANETSIPFRTYLQRRNKKRK